MTEVQPTALLRAEASAQIGLGHIGRCLALALSLEERRWRCVFHSPTSSASVDDVLSGRFEIVPDIASNEHFQLIIIDDYGVEAPQESQLRTYCDFLCVLEDRPTRDHECDFLLDPSPGRTSTAYEGRVKRSCRLLLGPEFALVAPSFSKARPISLARRELVSRPDRVFIGFGAADKHGMTFRALSALARVDGLAGIDIAVPSSYTHLERVRQLINTLPNATLHVDSKDIAGLMARSDIALGAAGTMSFERCCLGVPSIVIVTAENQTDIAKGLDESGSALVLGPPELATEEVIAHALEKMLNDPDVLFRMSSAAAQLCDGVGAPRVAEFLTNLVSKQK